MNNFVVPQFIDVEAKILGPITLRQFVITLIGGFFVVMAYKFLTVGPFILAALGIAGIVFLFGFFKVNGRPFHYFILSVLQTIKRPAVRIWKPKPTAQVKQLANTSEIGSMKELEQKSREAPNRSRLQELTLVVDTGGVYRGADDEINLNF